MKKVYTLTLGALFGISSLAQTTNLGGPYAWKEKVVLPKVIDTRTMPGYDQASIDAEDLINDETKEGPWRFGYKYETDFSLDNSGTWTTLPNGTRIWQLGLVCDGAMTVNLIFENLFIPEGAYIYLYDAEKTNRVGAYTNRNNNIEKILGTELVHGDHIVVEYFEPAAVSGQGTLKVANVIHGYRSLNKVQGDLMKDWEESGDCNVDVNCPLGAGWENEIRSVAMIVVGGSGICTGALINNTCDDGTPYFLTADHCVGGSTASWAFRFNWESPPGTEVCQTVGMSVDPGGPYDQTANGATQLYTSGATDVALLQITNMTLTDAQNWNCYYAGWDNSDALTVTQGTGIHHPSVDLKKICREDNALTQEPWNGAACWRVNNWDQGVTEPGSSGSPLFDQNHRIIGQLYGGGAACTGTNDNNQPDWYGRFGVSWPNLDNWLAPASCGTAPTTHDGWDPSGAVPATDDAGITSVISPVGNFCNGNMNPVVTLRNYGSNPLTSVTINYDIDGGTNNVFLWTGTLAPSATVNVTLPSFTSLSGTHNFNAYTTLPNGLADPNPGNNDATASYNVALGGEELTLTIATDCWGYETAWQIIDVSSNVVMEGGNPSIAPGGQGVSSPGSPGAYSNLSTITENFCLAVGCYDLIIYDDYGDGMTGCSTEGSYELSDASSTVILSIIDPDFGDSESQNFCVTNTCGGVISGSYVVSDEMLGNDGAINLTVTGVTGTADFVWIGPGSFTANTEDITGLAAGTYSVIITDDLGCVLEFVGIVVGSSVSITELDGVDYTLYPNPSSGVFTIDLGAEPNSDIQISITDVSGRIVYSQTSGVTQFIQLDFSDKAAGTYYITISTNDINVVKTFIKSN